MAAELRATELTLWNGAVVEFGPGPLGLSIGVQGGRLTVTGFKPLPDGSVGPAQQSGKVSEGALVSAALASAVPAALAASRLTARAYRSRGGRCHHPLRQRHRGQRLLARTAQVIAGRSGAPRFHRLFFRCGRRAAVARACNAILTASSLAGLRIL